MLGNGFSLREKMDFHLFYYFFDLKITQVEEIEPPPTHTKFKRAVADVFRGAKNSRAL